MTTTVPLCKYVDFVLNDMSKVKNIYALLKNFVDYAVTNWDKANQQSVKMAAENTYHYFNESALLRHQGLLPAPGRSIPKGG